MRKQICIKVVDSDNATQCACRIEFTNEKDLDQALHGIVTLGAIHGIFIAESLEFPLTLGGIPVQSNANKERSERYFKTGN